MGAGDALHDVLAWLLAHSPLVVCRIPERWASGPRQARGRPTAGVSPRRQVAAGRAGDGRWDATWNPPSW